MSSNRFPGVRQHLPQYREVGGVTRFFLREVLWSANAAGRRRSVFVGSLETEQTAEAYISGLLGFGVSSIT